MRSIGREFEIWFVKWFERLRPV